MCGLAGFIFKPSSVSASRRAILASSLASLNVERGRSSWGVVRINESSNEITIKKGLGPISSHMYALINSNALYLHTRAATCGSVTLNNAHPFTFGNIIGAHNGAVFNHELLDLKYGRNFDVDSMHLFAHLAEGMDFKDVEGYGAIQWVDKAEPNRIYFCRISGSGQLSVAGVGTSKSTSGIVWSSSGFHLESALKAAGIVNYFEYPIKDYQVYFVENGELYVQTGQKLELHSWSSNSSSIMESMFGNVNWTNYRKRNYKKPINRSTTLLLPASSKRYICSKCGTIKPEALIDSTKDDEGNFSCPMWPKNDTHFVWEEGNYPGMGAM